MMSKKNKYILIDESHLGQLSYVYISDVVNNYIIAE